MTIADIQTREDLILVTDTEDVTSIKDHLLCNLHELEVIISLIEDVDGFFVKTGNGQYLEVYGFSGIIPILTKELTQFI